MTPSSPDIRRPVDRWLLFFAVLLLTVGLVWVYSSSAFKNPKMQTYFLMRQLVGGGLGLAVMLVLSQVDLSMLRENPKPLQFFYGAILVALILVFFFPAKNAAHRWIQFGSQSFQPSEIFKPLSVMLCAWWMVRFKDSWNNRQESLPRLVILCLILAVPLGLIVAEPDFGTTFLITLVALLVVFLGGAPRWIFAVVIPVLGLVGFLFVRFSAYRWARFTSYLRPEDDPLGKGLQAIQSLIAVGNGGFTGVGIGGSMQKLSYLPEAHNDFIFAVICEEAGLIGSTIVVLLFLGVLWRGYHIARRVRDGFLKLCAMGFTLLLVVQAFMNISVVLSLAPNKGIPLPFISYGSSSLIASLASLGLLLAISKEAGESGR
jgi:cell division protein FtsW